MTFKGFCVNVTIGLSLIVLAVTGLLGLFSLLKLFWIYLFGG